MIFHAVEDPMLNKKSFLFAVFGKHRQLCPIIHNNRCLLTLSSEYMLVQPVHLLFQVGEFFLQHRILIAKCSNFFC